MVDRRPKEAVTSEIFAGTFRAGNTNTLDRKLAIEHIRLHQIAYKPRITLSVLNTWCGRSLFSDRNSSSCKLIHGLCFSQIGPSSCLPRALTTECFSARSLYRQNAARCSQGETRKVRDCLPRGTFGRRYVDLVVYCCCISRGLLDKSFELSKSHSTETNHCCL